MIDKQQRQGVTSWASKRGSRRSARKRRDERQAELRRSEKVALPAYSQVRLGAHSKGVGHAPRLARMSSSHEPEAHPSLVSEWQLGQVRVTQLAPPRSMLRDPRIAPAAA